MAKPGPAPKATPLTSTIAVIGFTSGIAAKASRPSAASAASAATSATIRARRLRALVPPEGELRPSQTIANDASCQLTSRPPRARRPLRARRRDRGSAREQLAAACSGSSALRGAAEDARRFGREVPARRRAPRRSGRRRSRARGRAAPRAVANSAANSVSWVATSTACPLRGLRGAATAPAPLGRPVHAAGGLVEGDHGRGLARRRGRSPARAAGARRRRGRVGCARRARRGRQLAQRRGGRLIADALVQEVVAGVLQQQRDAAGAARPAARGLEQARGVPQQGGLAGAVAAHQRRPSRRRGAARSTPRRIAGPSRSSCQTPLSASAGGRRSPRAWRRRANRRGAARGPVRRLADGASRGEQPVSAQRRACLLDARSAAGAGRRPRTAVRRASAAAGSCSAAHSRNPRGSRSQTSSPSASARRGRRRPGSARGGARSAAPPCRHSWLSRRSCQISSSPATGSSCEVGSSSSTSRGRGASAAASATRCSSPPESSAVERSSSSAMPSESAVSSTARATAAGRQAAVLQRERELGAHGAITTWVSGSCSTVPAGSPISAGGVLARVEAGDQHGAGEARRRGSAGRARRRRAAASTCPSPRARRRTQNSPGSSDRLTSRRAGPGRPG